MYLTFLLILIPFLRAQEEKKVHLPKHSFSSPFGQDVPFWAVSGSARVQPDEIVLSQESTSGALWNDFLLSESPDWEVVFSFSTPSNFAFWYTSSKLTSGPVAGSQNKWQGLSVFFEPSDSTISSFLSDGAEFDPNNKNQPDTIKSLGSCKSVFSGVSKSVKVRFSEGSFSISLRTKDQNGLSEWESCLSSKINLPAGYFFGFSSASSSVKIQSVLAYSVEPQLPTSKRSTETKDELKALQQELEILKAKVQIEKLQRELGQAGTKNPEPAEPAEKEPSVLERLKAFRKNRRVENVFRRGTENLDFNWKKTHQESNEDANTRILKEEQLAREREAKLEQIRTRQEHNPEHDAKNKITASLERHIREQEQFQWDLEDFAVAGTNLYQYMEDNIHDSLRTLQNQVLALIPEMERVNSVNPSIQKIDSQIKAIKITLENLKSRAADTQQRTHRISSEKQEGATKFEGNQSQWDKWVWIIVLEVLGGVIYFFRQMKDLKSDEHYSLG